MGAVEFISESSPILVLGFLGAGLFLTWLDGRDPSPSLVETGGTLIDTNVAAVNSPYGITGLAAGRDIIINPGISEECSLSPFSGQTVRGRQLQGASPSDLRELNEDLMWRIVDDIREARRRFEHEEVAKLVSELRKCFGRHGDSWPKVLRTEAILLFAEEERARILQARAGGREVDQSVFQELLQQLLDGRT
jgi:hypothetical protein